MEYKENCFMKKWVVKCIWGLFLLLLLPFTCFAADDGQAEGERQEKNIFVDIKETDSYFDSILYVSEKGFMNGTSPNTFMPNGQATRAMMATVLWRMAGCPAVTGSSCFSDVPSTAWYGKGVVWAAQNKIFNGYEDGTFRPYVAISREQCAAIFYRYAQLQKDMLFSFSKTLSEKIIVSPWAQADVQWALDWQLLSETETVLNWQETAARWEIAVMMHHLLEKIAVDDGQETIKGTMTKECMVTKTIPQFQYWLYQPASVEPNMPLIVYLHGGSGKGNDLDLLITGDGFPQYVQSGKIGNIPAYIIMPQLPSDLKGWTDGKEALQQLITSVCNTYSIDPENISLTGHSMGGTGVWGIATAYPNMFTRIAPLSGSVKVTNSNVQALANTAVWAMVGSADTIVPPDSSSQMIQKLQQGKNTAKITIFDGATHFDVPQLAYLNEDFSLLQWLISGDSKSE